MKTSEEQRIDMSVTSYELTERINAAIIGVCQNSDNSPLINTLLEGGQPYMAMYYMTKEDSTFHVSVKDLFFAPHTKLAHAAKKSTIAKHAGCALHKMLNTWRSPNDTTQAVVPWNISEVSHMGGAIVTTAQRKSTSSADKGTVIHEDYSEYIIENANLAITNKKMCSQKLGRIYDVNCGLFGSTPDGLCCMDSTQFENYLSQAVLTVPTNSNAVEELLSYVKFSKYAGVPLINHEFKSTHVDRMESSSKKNKQEPCDTGKYISSYINVADVQYLFQCFKNERRKSGFSVEPADPVNASSVPRTASALVKIIKDKLTDGKWIKPVPQKQRLCPPNYMNRAYSVCMAKDWSERNVDADDKLLKKYIDRADVLLPVGEKQNVKLLKSIFSKLFDDKKCVVTLYDPSKPSIENPRQHTPLFRLIFDNTPFILTPVGLFNIQMMGQMADVSFLNRSLRHIFSGIISYPKRAPVRMAVQVSFEVGIDEELAKVVRCNLVDKLLSGIDAVTKETFEPWRNVTYTHHPVSIDIDDTDDVLLADNNASTSTQSEDEDEEWLYDAVDNLRGVTNKRKRVRYTADTVSDSDSSEDF